MDIYTVNDELIETLNKSNLILPTSKAFKLCKSNASKVKLIEKLLIDYDRIPKIIPRRAKDNSRSKELRQKGNSLFGRGKSFDALELYNESICWADSQENAEDLAIGYANRSAVYFKWKKYELCMRNIKLAKEAGYPKRLMDKLLKREGDALDHINNDVDAKVEKDLVIPPLSIQSNSQIPFIANCLELRESSDQGRYLITNTDLTPGQIIAMEEPYAVYLQPCSRYHRCNYCLTENTLNLIPCPLCTNAMFCSKKCLNQANNEYHRIECAISDYLLTLFNKIHRSALRVSLKALKSFESVTAMIAFCKENESSNVTTFSLDYSNPLSAVQHYEPVHCLATNQDKRKPSDMFQRATIAAVLFNQLMKHSELMNILKSSESQSAFIEILLRHLQTAPTNFHTLGLAETPIMEGIDYASGAYPFCSLLNHSCAPNICRMPMGRTMVVFVLRAIKQGEQLFDNYGQHHCMRPKEDRQSSLSFQYNFQCNCEACRNDYSTIMELSMAPNVPNIHSDDDIAKLILLDADFAAENLLRFCKYLTQYDDHYPCKQISEIQENLKMCYNILFENYSLKARCEKFAK